MVFAIKRSCLSNMPALHCAKVNYQLTLGKLLAERKNFEVHERRLPTGPRTVYWPDTSIHSRSASQELLSVRSRIASIFFLSFSQFLTRTFSLALLLFLPPYPHVKTRSRSGARARAHTLYARLTGRARAFPLPSLLALFPSPLSLPPFCPTLRPRYVPLRPVTTTTNN